MTRSTHCTRLLSTALTLVLVSAGTMAAQAAQAKGQAPAPAAGELLPTPRFDLPTGPLTLRQPALPNHPFTVTGRSGVILGMQDGSVELWQLPVKFFSGLHLSAEIDGYTVPIDLNTEASELEVSPDHTTLTYSHAAITVRQHMFAPAGEGNEGLGGMILFEIHSIHPATLTVSLTPAMIRQWPAPQFGIPGAGWHAMGGATGSTAGGAAGGTAGGASAGAAGGGAYVLSTDNPHLFGMIGLANSTPGVLSPYQERPTTRPLEFKLRFDPAKDADHFFPLLCELNRPDEMNSEAAVNAMAARLAKTAAELPAIYARTQSYFAHFFDTRLIPHTPDPRLDLALRWAELAIDKAQVTTDGETGLVAGWYPSFDSARPGFGWYFGRDTLWSMYAINSYGDRELARRAFEFLIKRQRADGKMPHEWSLTAGTLTGELAWQNFPYEYASADGTPLYLLAMRDYMRASGDTEFLRTHWESLQKAYRFERTHDSDGDGVYDNSQGTGWVEDWPRQPHQELYLASLDRDATLAMAELAQLVNENALATEASAVAAKLAVAVEGYRDPKGLYAFSKNTDGSYDRTVTVYPSVALWFSPRGMAEPGTMLSAWAGSRFSADWGTRALAETESAYDPISYHRGSIWPLFTGWTSMAEYNSGRPLAGYAALMRNVGLTWTGDPGAVTEVLSGRFHQPLGRSSTHQLWSSAMTLTPAVRGLFGVVADAPSHALIVNPHLPAGWSEASLEHVRVGSASYTVTLRREGGHLLVTAASDTPEVLCLHEGFAVSEEPCRETATALHRLQLPLPAIEVEPVTAGLPLPGAETTQPRIVDETYTTKSLALAVEAMGGTVVELKLHRNGKAIPHVEGASLVGDTARVSMPAGTGFVVQRVQVSW